PSGSASTMRTQNPPVGGSTPRRGDDHAGPKGGTRAMKHHMNGRLIMTALVVAMMLAGTPALAKKGERLVKLRLGPFKVEPQRDREVCQAVKVPDVAGLEIEHWEARSHVTHGGDTASHHLVLYGYSGTDSTKFPKDMVDDPGCAAFGPPDFFKAR